MSEYRLTEAQRCLVMLALEDMANLAVAYERRLVFKDRSRRKALLAATSYKGAKAILRSLDPVVRDECAKSETERVSE